MTALDLARISRAAYDASATVPAVEPAKPVAPVNLRLVFLSAAPFSTPLSTAMSTTATLGPPKIPAPKTPVPTAAGVWKLRESWKNGLGFYCAVYTLRDEEVLVFRGTDDAWDGLVDDAQIFVGTAPLQTFAALTATDLAGLSKGAYLTGHSLGGALAVIVAAFYNRAAVTFNAPGVTDSCTVVSPLALNNGFREFLKTVGRCVANHRILNIRIGGDFVSSRKITGMQPGKTDTLKVDTCGINALCRHSINSMIEVMETDPKYSQPLAL